MYTSIKMGDKEGVLLNWVKTQIQKYPRVEVKDFTTSWQDGLAFCALVDSLSPGKINTKILTSVNREKNLKLAFETLSSLGVPKMLDESEILEKPDEDSIITYLTSIYHLLGQDDGTKNDLNPAKGSLIKTLFSTFFREVEKCTKRIDGVEAKITAIQKGSSGKGTTHSASL